MNNRICYLAIVLAHFVGACASTPPPVDFLDDAQAAVQRAADAGALEYAPLELRYAREKLDAARAAVQERDYELAGWLAQESTVNSELAIAKTIAAQARDASRAKSEENARLREELGIEATP